MLDHHFSASPSHTAPEATAIQANDYHFSFGLDFRADACDFIFVFAVACICFPDNDFAILGHTTHRLDSTLAQEPEHDHYVCDMRPSYAHNMRRLAALDI